MVHFLHATRIVHPKSLVLLGTALRSGIADIWPPTVQHSMEDIVHRQTALFGP